MLFCSNSAHFSKIQLVCDLRTDGTTDGRTDRRTDGPTDGRTDGRTDRRTGTRLKICIGTDYCELVSFLGDFRVDLQWFWVYFFVFAINCDLTLKNDDNQWI